MDVEDGEGGRGGGLFIGVSFCCVTFFCYRIYPAVECGIDKIFAVH